MPVDFVKESEGKKWFKFSRGTACEGTDYNEGDTGQISERWALIFQAQGRGTILDGPPAGLEPAPEHEQVEQPSEAEPEAEQVSEQEPEQASEPKKKAKK